MNISRQKLSSIDIVINLKIKDVVSKFGLPLKIETQLQTLIVVVTYFCFCFVFIKKKKRFREPVDIERW